MNFIIALFGMILAVLGLVGFVGQAPSLDFSRSIVTRRRKRWPGKASRPKRPEAYSVQYVEDAEGA